MLPAVAKCTKRSVWVWDWPNGARRALNASRASPLHLSGETLPAAAPVGPLEPGNRNTGQPGCPWGVSDFPD
jgi:hypothetical protein